MSIFKKFVKVLVFSFKLILFYIHVSQGHLPDGSTVAVKQLLTPTQQTMDDFLNEVVLLTGAKHRNLVKLKGCCLRGNQRLLVYEYMEKYDLADVIFGKINTTIPF